MIMYAWKQFGNDFRNGDDAVFWDSNRPRDDNGTKIRPWLQGDKWSFRDVNKKTDFSDIVLKWWSEVAKTDPWTPVKFEIPTIRKDWGGKSDWLSVWYPEIAWDDENAKLWAFDNEFHNVPQYIISESDYQYHYTSTESKTKKTACLEIQKTWLYYVECGWQYMFSYDNLWNYNSNNAYLYKERIGLMQYNKEEWQFSCVDKRSYRAVWNGDQVVYTSILWLDSWTKLLPCAALYQPTWKNGVYMRIHLIQLW